MIEIKDKATCCGCSACFNACPKECITMERDFEGFLYSVIDKNTCINCGLCEKACPILNITNVDIFEQKGYLVQIKDDKIQKESITGGPLLQ